MLRRTLSDSNMRLSETAQDRSGDTAAAILDAAERLFGERGFAAVSVRDITAAAGANVAAVNYHFGSKEALILAAFDRRAEDISRDRLHALRAAEADGPLKVRAVLHALLAPAMAWRAAEDQRRHAVAFVMRARVEGGPAVRARIDGNVTLLVRFASALRRALPGLSEADATAGLMFALALEHDLAREAERLRALAAGLIDPDDHAAMLERMLDFAEAGVAAGVQRA